MKFTKEQIEKAKAAKSVEELLTLAKENGIELTEEDAAKYFTEWHKEGELAGEELENVSGGGCQSDLFIADVNKSFCFNYSNYHTGKTYLEVGIGFSHCCSCRYAKSIVGSTGHCNDYDEFSKIYVVTE